MSYRVIIPKSIHRRILRWGLSDVMVVEVFLRLKDRLAGNVAGLTIRTRRPFDGLTYHFSMVAPDNRFSSHSFWFHILFTQDEELLMVANAAYRRFSL